MTDYTVTIPGVMRGKQRPRASMRGGYARLYTPAETVNAEAHIRQCCIQQIGQPCLSEPLEVWFRIDVAIPASWSKKKRQQALDGEIHPTGKPDLDNSIKLLDALNGIAWKDDAQIVSISAWKRYAEAPSAMLRFRVYSEDLPF